VQNRKQVIYLVFWCDWCLISLIVFTDSNESGNVNVRAAFIHVLGDLLQSLGVLIAAFIIYFKVSFLFNLWAILADAWSWTMEVFASGASSEAG